MRKRCDIRIEADTLELDIDYTIEDEKIKIEYLGLAANFYWSDNELDESITPDHVKELMDTINRSMFTPIFTQQLLEQIPPLLQQQNRKDLAVVAFDWLSRYMTEPQKNVMRL